MDIFKDLEKPSGPPYLGKSGAALTQSLFYEKVIDQSDRLYAPVFCLYGEREGLISCQKTFVEVGDPTGYRWAMTYLNDYKHFKRLMDLKWFKEAYSVWIEELVEKQKSNALTQILKMVEDEKVADGQRLNAAKYILEEGWEKKRGRPSKAEISGKLKEQTRLLQDEKEDLERIGLSVIQGGKKKKKNNGD